MTDHPPDDAIRIVPDVPRLEHDDVPEEYAISLRDDVPGGCIVWSRWRGEWTVNPWSKRALVRTLLVGRAESAERIANLLAGHDRVVAALEADLIAARGFDPNATDLGIADNEARMRHPFYGMRADRDIMRNWRDMEQQRAEAAEDALTDITAMATGRMAVPDDPWIGGEDARPVLGEALNAVSAMVRRIAALEAKLTTYSRVLRMNWRTVGGEHDGGTGGFLWHTDIHGASFDDRQAWIHLVWARDARIAALEEELDATNAGAKAEQARLNDRIAALDSELRISRDCERAAVEELDRWRNRRVLPVEITEARADGVREGREAERADVLAWLYKHLRFGDLTIPGTVSQHIKRGSHRSLPSPAAPPADSVHTNVGRGHAVEVAAAPPVAGPWTWREEGGGWGLYRGDHQTDWWHGGAFTRRQIIGEARRLRGEDVPALPRTGGAL